MIEQRAHLRAQDAIVRPHGRVRIFFAQIFLEDAVAVADHHAAHAARRRGQQQPSERRIGNREIDLDAGRTFSICRRRHAEGRAGPLVEPAARAVPGVVDGRCHALPFLQGGLDLAETARLDERARRNADDSREGALKVEAAQPDVAGQRAQRVALFGVRSDDVARTLYLFNLCCHGEEDNPGAWRNLSEHCFLYRRSEDYEIKR